MSVVIKTIKDYFNNYVYPKTKTKAVYDDSNNRLDTTLSTVVHFDNDSSSGTISDPVLKQSDIATTLGTSDTVPASQKLVNTVNTNLGSPSSASSVTGADAFSKISTLNSDLTYVNATITPQNNALYADTKAQYNAYNGFLAANIYWGTAKSISAQSWLTVGQLSCTLSSRVRGTYYDTESKTYDLCQINTDGTIQLYNSSSSAKSIRDTYVNMSFARS